MDYTTKIYKKWVKNTSLIRTNHALEFRNSLIFNNIESTKLESQTVIFFT